MDPLAGRNDAGHDTLVAVIAKDGTTVANAKVEAVAWIGGAAAENGMFTAPIVGVDPGHHGETAVKQAELAGCDRRRDHLVAAEGKQIVHAVKRYGFSARRRCRWWGRRLRAHTA